MNFTSHALLRLQERTSLSPEEFISRLSDHGVLERIEKKGAKHYIVWLPEEGEFFCAVVDNDIVITFMPLIWRAKQVSEKTLQMAHEAAELDLVVSKPVKTPCAIRYKDTYPHVHEFGSSAFRSDGSYDTRKLRDEVKEVRHKYQVSDHVSVLVQARIDSVWTDLCL